MDRIPRIGDIIRISSPDDSRLFVVEAITTNKLSLYDPFNNSIKFELTIPNENYYIEILDKVPLTGNKLIDMNIMLQLDDNELNLICMTDKYTNSICQEDYFWKLRIRKIYPRFPIPNKYRTQHRLLYNEIRLFTMQELWDWAVNNGYLNIMKWVIHFEPTRRLSGQDFNTIIIKGYIRIIKWLDSKGVQFEVEDLNKLAMYGHLDVLKWFAEKRLYPDQNGANLAAQHGQLEVMKWLIQNNIYPNQRGVNIATRNGQLEALKLLSQYNIYPDQEGANNIIGNLIIYPGSDELLSKGRHIEILNWLAEHNIYPNQEGADDAFVNNDTEVLEWMLQHNIYPDPNLINEDTIISDNVDSVKLLISYSIFPDQEGINKAAEFGEIELLDILAQHNLYPNEEALDTALATNNTLVLLWLNQHNIN